MAVEEEVSEQTMEEAGAPTDGLSMIVFSGDLDKLLAAFIIANGAAAMDTPVTMFFTFWGLNALRKSESVKVKKSLVERMFGWMMPRGADKVTLSKMNMGGMGTMIGTIGLSNINPAFATPAASTLDPNSLSFRNPFGEGVIAWEPFAGERGTPQSQISLGTFARLVLGFGFLGWILEAVITGLIVGYVARIRPDLIGVQLRDEHR